MARRQLAITPRNDSDPCQGRRLWDGEALGDIVHDRRSTLQRAFRFGRGTSRKKLRDERPPGDRERALREVDRLVPAMQEWEPYRLTPHELICDGGKVVSVGRFRGTSRVTGKHVEVDYSHIWEVEDGKIVRLRQFIDAGKIEPARHPG